jgi:hypothetical protein
MSRLSRQGCRHRSGLLRERDGAAKQQCHGGSSSAVFLHFTSHIGAAKDLARAITVASAIRFPAALPTSVILEK